MPHSPRYAVSPDVLSSQLDGEAILLHLPTQSYCRLNPTAAAIWQGLERGLARDELLASLARSFELEEGRAAEEMDRLIAELVERRFIEGPAPAGG